MSAITPVPPITYPINRELFPSEADAAISAIINVTIPEINAIAATAVGDVATAIGAASADTPVGADKIVFRQNSGGLLKSITLTNLLTYLSTAFSALTFKVANLISGYSTTETAAETTTLTALSNYLQYFTGTTTQTVVMPVVTTLTLGQQFKIVNNSTGAVTVNSSGGNAIVVLLGGEEAIITCIAITGTTASSWSKKVFVDTENTQTIAGVKTFSSPVGVGNPVGAGDAINGQNGDILGIKTQSQKPSFLAKIEQQNNVTGDGTLYNVVAATVIRNVGSCFDGASTFTAPVAGLYKFKASYLATGLLNTHNVFQIVLVSSNRTYTRQLYATAASGNIFTEANPEIFELVDMDAGDVCILRIVVFGGTKVVDLATAETFSFFSGSLVC